MSWLRHLAICFAFLGAFARPASASALSPASPEARVGGIQVAANLLARDLGAAIRATHQGIGAAYDENASGYRIAAEGAGVRFTQTTTSVAFKNGPLAGQTIGEVAGGLRAGTIQAGQLPVDVVVRGGQTLAINTRSTLALTRAGVPVSEWTMVNRTGDAFFEERLARNGLTDLGTDVLRITGAGPNASATW